MTLKLYIAGPLFTPYHRARHARNAVRLRDEGFVCLVPHEGGVENMVTWKPPGPSRSIFVFDACRNHVVKADAIVALLDDPDVSSGLANEIGLFWAMKQREPWKKGVLGMVTDDRALRRAAQGLSPINAFTLGCILDIGCIYNNLDSIVTHLHAWRQGREMPTGGIYL